MENLPMFRMHLIIVVAAISLLLALPARAEEAKEAAKPAAPTLSDVLAASGITLSGYVDLSYEHLDGEGLFTSGAPTRTFDDRKDSFSLHQVSVAIAYQPKEGFGAVVSLIAGQDPDVFAPYDINPGAHSKFDFPQAYVQYATGAWTVIAGRFYTLAGSESIDPRPNTNFSRSILFGNAIPFAHTGVRATYAASDQLSLVFGVNNGWDDLKDTNSAKTAELAVLYTPIKAVSLTAQGYFGKERVGGLVGFGPEGMRKLVDVVANWSVTDAFSLGLNYDWARQEGSANTGLTADNADTARWNGVAAYVNYQFSGEWRLSVRAEYFDDQDGYRTGIVQKWKEGTVTVGYSPAKSVELRLEARADKSDGSVFVKSFATDPETGALTDTSDHQTSIALEALYKF
jgi:hypothetical protein